MNLIPRIAEFIMAHPVGFVFAFASLGTTLFFGAVHFGEWIEGKWRQRGEGIKLAQDAVTPDLDRSPGAMTEDQREAALMELLKWWRLDDHPVMDASVAGRCGLTRQQAAAFMHWARGQVRDFGGGRWLCKVERGHQACWLRFVRVNVIAAGEGVHA